MLWTKAAYQNTVFQTFECSNESSSLCFCSSNLSTKTTLHKKSPLTRNVRTFEWLGENLPNSSYTFETTSQFFLKLYITLQCHERKLFCIFFSWNFMWFGQKETIKVRNLIVLTAHVKFHQICTLISSFCWNYIKF